MLSKIWRWLNREDTRPRYPDGQLVIEGPWAAGAVHRFFDLLPLWIQRVGGLLFQVIGWLVIGVLVLKIAWPSLW
jgi:hypothetical protein